MILDFKKMQFKMKQKKIHVYIYNSRNTTKFRTFLFDTSNALKSVKIHLQQQQKISYNITSNYRQI